MLQKLAAEVWLCLDSGVAGPRTPVGFCSPFGRCCLWWGPGGSHLPPVLCPCWYPPEELTGVRVGDLSVGPDAHDMAQHAPPTWDTQQLCCRCVPGFGVQAGGERGAEGGLGLQGAWGTGIIEPGLQHRCGTGWSSCLQQLVYEPGPREVNQPQGRAQGACIQ